MTQTLNSNDPDYELAVSSSRNSVVEQNFAEAAEAMREDGLDVLASIQLVLKWWWLIALTTIVPVALTLFFVLRTTPIYSATTLIEVNPKERSVIDSSVDERVVGDYLYIETQMDLIQSASSIDAVVDELDLVRDPEFFRSNNGITEPASAETVARSVRRRLQVEARRGTRLIEVRFEHSSPQRAAEISNGLSEIYISESLKKRFSETEYLQQFLTERLSTAKASLEEAERALVDYARENDILILSGGDTNGAQQSIEAADLTKLSSRLSEVISEQVAVTNELKSGADTNFQELLLSNATLSELTSEKTTLEQTLAELLKTFKDGYPDVVRLKAELAVIDERISALIEELVSSRRESLQGKLGALRAEKASLETRIDQLKSSIVASRDRSVQYNILSRKLDTERAQYASILQRLNEVSVSDDLDGNLLQVVDAAKPPRRPVRPQKTRAVFQAIVFGLALGIGLVFAIEYIDDRIKKPDDIRRKLKSAILGVVPTFKAPNGDLAGSLHDSKSVISEAYATFRTNLQLSGGNGGPRVLQITSTRSGEGKSVSSLGVALRFAALGGRVLMIEADMRVPTFFREGQNSVGLSGVLSSECDFGEEILPTRYEGFYLLPSGRSAPNPSELLAGGRFQELLDYARGNFDYVIVDCPPLLGLADSLIIASRVDATVLAVQANRLRTSTIRDSINRLAGADVKILGVVLTQFNASSSDAGYYYYSYGQSSGSKRTQTKTSGLAKKKNVRNLDVLSGD